MIRTIIAFLLLTATSWAGTCVAVQTNAGSAGTCVVIYQHKNGVYVAMTAKHVVADATSVYLSVGEKWAKASKFYALKDLDAAFIEFQSPDQKLNPFPIACDDPAPGDTVTFVGFAYGNDWVEGKQEGVVETVGRATQANYPPYKGQSGGAVLDSGRRVVGVVSATSPNTLHYVPLGQIRAGCIRQWNWWCGPRGCQPQQPMYPPAQPYSPPYSQPYLPQQPRPQSPTPAPEDDIPETIPIPIAPRPITPEAEDPPAPPSVLRGPQGPAGPPGPPGPPGKDVSASIAILQAELNVLKAKMVERPSSEPDLKPLTDAITELILKVHKLENVETPVRVRRKSDGVVISEERVKLALGQPINLDLDDKTMEELRKLLGK